MIKKFVACLALVGMLALPIGCTKAKFVSTTDKIGEALAVINLAYSVLEAQLEAALQKDLPDADKIRGYLKYVGQVRDLVAQGYDLFQAEAAAGVAVKMVEQASEVVE